jgi:uncharacterized protein (DUF1697 family)
MQTYISLLRGINVGGKNSIKMAALTNVYIGLGLHNVTTYLQSGNVLFTAKQLNAANTANAISTIVQQQFGCNVDVLILSLNNLQKIIAANTFAQQPNANLAFLHVTFLFTSPRPAVVQAFNKQFGTALDVQTTKNAVYLNCPNGYSNTKFTNNFLQAKLQVVATTRSFKTVLQLQQLSASI